ncbi:hypothetical protein lbkm_2270 [Lachnospiraceae bacterium KM106-2]|nr:hypothetical protein lbkm_2270 [Lachnospiraceae bacterium KM106-2]
MKKIIKMIGVMLVVAPILFVVSVPIVNDYTASRVVKELEKIPIPKKTEYLESISKAGKLAGNGNGMQYLGVLLIKSELSVEELSTYYSKFNQECVVEEQFGQNIAFSEHVELAFDTEVSGSGYYLVYRWGNGKEPFASLDIRGH